MATPEQARREEEEFAAAFNEGDKEPTRQSEGDVFGPGHDGAPEEPKPAEGAPAAEQDASQGDTAPGEVAAGDEAAPAVAIVLEPQAPEASAAIPADDADGEADPTDPKEVQRKKSWEGRLKAREAELKAREDALAAKGGQGPGEAGGDAAPPANAEEAAADIQAADTPQEAVEEAKEAVDSGAMSPEEAMKLVSQDFGDEFAKMLGVLIEHKASEIAGRMADERINGVRKDLNDVVDDVVKHRADTHFEILSDAHPDFLDVAESAEFKDWVEGLPEQFQEKAVSVIQRGSARQIVKLLNIYKEAGAKPEEGAGESEPADAAAVDAAEGVRSSSGGLQLPEAPSRDESYEDAWSKF